ncbi:hypothetical protein C8F04DRAFT_1255125 [Mycena alexandri]|uniref:Uncharacterized protein n=1 Tax=Mycena alexandri TaxID=1745969 RepID=A0AAD6T7W5_9AGAR|nr:hypothetical protein C8F04DRAFT_1255125 [Mycena alexandri]
MSQDTKKSGKIVKGTMPSFFPPVNCDPGPGVRRPLTLSTISARKKPMTSGRTNLLNIPVGSEGSNRLRRLRPSGREVEYRGTSSLQSTISGVLGPALQWSTAMLMISVVSAFNFFHIPFFTDAVMVIATRAPGFGWKANGRALNVTPLLSRHLLGYSPSKVLSRGHTGLGTRPSSIMNGRALFSPFYPLLMSSHKYQYSDSSGFDSVTSSYTLDYATMSAFALIPDAPLTPTLLHYTLQGHGQRFVGSSLFGFDLQRPSATNPNSDAYTALGKTSFSPSDDAAFRAVVFGDVMTIPSAASQNTFSLGCPDWSKHGWNQDDARDLEAHKKPQISRWLAEEFIVVDLGSYDPPQYIVHDEMEGYKVLACPHDVRCFPLTTNGLTSYGLAVFIRSRVQPLHRPVGRHAVIDLTPEKRVFCIFPTSTMTVPATDEEVTNVFMNVRRRELKFSNFAYGFLYATGSSRRRTVAIPYNYGVDKLQSINDLFVHAWAVLVDMLPQSSISLGHSYSIIYVPPAQAVVSVVNTCRSLRALRPFTGNILVVKHGKRKPVINMEKEDSSLVDCIVSE